VAQYQIDEGVPDGTEIDLKTCGIMSATDPSAYIQRELTCPETGGKYPNFKTGEQAKCPDEGKFPSTSTSPIFEPDKKASRNALRAGAEAFFSREKTLGKPLFCSIIQFFPCARTSNQKTTPSP
jgi:hypothetical protein